MSKFNGGGESRSYGGRVDGANHGLQEGYKIKGDAVPRSYIPPHTKPPPHAATATKKCEIMIVSQAFTAYSSREGLRAPPHRLGGRFGFPSHTQRLCGWKDALALVIHFFVLVQISDNKE